MIELRLKELNIEIPSTVKPAANYLPYAISGNKVFISGQLPIQDNIVKFKGKVGCDISIDQAKNAAEICIINIIANLKNACEGDLERVKRCIKLGIFVNSTPDFTDHPKVGNGASDLIVKIFNNKGKHSRFAVGVSSLPFGAAVEIDAIFEI